MSSPSRHAATSARDAGPYSWPRAASSSYGSPAQRGSAPGGGHAPSSPAAGRPGGSGCSDGSGASRPAACRVQAGSSSYREEGREWTSTGRRPASSGGPTPTWRSTAPSAGRTSGLSSVSSVRWSQPARVAAYRASSAKTEPGSRTFPSTRCSASQAGACWDTRPVSSNVSPPAGSTAAPSRGCPAVARPRPAGSPLMTRGASSQ